VRRSALVLSAALLVSAALLLAAPSQGESPRSDRVFADGFVTWIYARPEFDEHPIGYLRAGSSANTAGSGPVRAAGCPGGFQAVEPAGFVCLGKSASLTRTRYVQSLATLSPKPGPFPFSFALSMGSPAYRRLPTPSEVRRSEAKFGPAAARALPPHWRGHEELVGEGGLEVSAMPAFLADAGSASRLPEDRLVRREIPFGSMVAVTSSFSHDGRTYLSSADGTILPAERFRPFRASAFAGVEIGAPSDLPVAWTRRETVVHESTCPSERDGARRAGRLGAPASRDESCLAASTERLALRAAVPLTGRRIRSGKTTFVEARSGKWLKEADLYLAEYPEDLASAEHKWILFSIARGTLIAFEGARPTFVTLASPGSGGRPRPGGDPLGDRTTPLGTFRIQFKHRSDDMSPEQSEHRSFFIADVPHAQFFQPPFAIHVAYWHESFGEPMSGGCINVSPKDGARLFDWTEPALPAGWHGVGAGAEFGPGTWVRIVSN